MSNLKQIGLGLLQYTQDYDERYPCPGQTSFGGEQGCNGSADQASWRQKIYPYVKSTQLFACPSNTANAQIASAGAPGVPGSPDPQMPVSYMINRNMYLTPDNYGGLAMAQIQEVATRIAVVDGGNSTFTGWTTYVPGWDAGLSTARGFAGHLGTFCVAYADGHVKAKRPTSTATPVNERGRGDLASPDPSCSAFIAAEAINCKNVDPSAAPNHSRARCLRPINCKNVDPSVTPGMIGLDKKYNRPLAKVNFEAAFRFKRG